MFLLERLIYQIVRVGCISEASYTQKNNKIVIKIGMVHDAIAYAPYARLINHINAIHFRHFHIDNRNIKFIRTKFFKPFDSIRSGFDSFVWLGICIFVPLFFFQFERITKQ